MERLVNSFTVNRPIDEAWQVLTNLERIAPCMPGARLKEIDGEVHRGSVKVRVGAFSTEFEGEAHFVERDPVAHRAVLAAAGLARGSLGQAEAHITATLTEVEGSTTTECTVEADLDITGKVAQFGRGIMSDVSAKLMAQFASNLDRMLAEAVTADPPPTELLVPTAAPSTLSSAPSSPDASAGGVRVVDSGAAEAIDLSRVGGGAVLKRLLPVLVALVVLGLGLGLVRSRVRRRRRR